MHNVCVFEIVLVLASCRSAVNLFVACAMWTLHCICLCFWCIVVYFTKSCGFNCPTAYAALTLAASTRPVG